MSGLERLGFVGLGDMGEGMAWNLLEKGFRVMVHDIRPEVVTRLEEDGAEVAASLEELARNCDAVFVAVFDDRQVRQVCLGEDGAPGLIGALSKTDVLVVHSTVSPATHRLLAERGAERGVSVLDAAMTGGGGAAARKGALTFFVGGPADTVARVRPALDAMATNVFHVGPVGSGVTVKIINNFMGVSNVALVREAIRLSRSMGLDETTVLSMVEAGGVGSSWVSRNWEQIREQEAGYTTGKSGMVAMARKDLQLAAALSEETDTDMPVLRFVLENVIPDLDTTGLTG